MAENPKYPVLELKEEDKKLLDGVIIKAAVNFHSCLEEYPNPKIYAEKVFLKFLDSKADIGAALTMIYAKIDPPGDIFEPGQLNRRIANDMRYNIRSEGDISTTGVENINLNSNFLHSRDLSGVLKKNVSLDILIPVKGKKNISLYKNKIKKKRTKVPTNENIEDRGGYPSAYAISEEVMRIRKIAEKTGAMDYFRERMNQYGIGYDLARYIAEAIFYATKMDKRMLPLLGVIGTRSMNNHLAENDIHELETLSQSLQSISDGDLEIIADGSARLLIEHLGYHELLILGSSLTKLWNI
jgi:hypothetical protein